MIIQKQTSLGVRNTLINISDYAAGVYMIQLTDIKGKLLGVERFVVLDN